MLNSSSGTSTSPKTEDPVSDFHVRKGTSGAGSVAVDSNRFVTFENSDTCLVTLLSPAANNSGITFGNPTVGDIDGRVFYKGSTRGLSLYSAGKEIIRCLGTSASMAGGTADQGAMFLNAGVVIDRLWANYPGMSCMRDGVDGDNNAATYPEFRFHGTNGTVASYPGISGADYSIGVRVDDAYYTGSDRRRKTQITEITDALETVKQLTGKRFKTTSREGTPQDSKTKTGFKHGFIAQEIEDIIPDIVKYYPDEDDGTEGWNSAYSIDYGTLTPLLVNAIKEQQTIIDDLKSRIETLEG